MKRKKAMLRRDWKTDVHLEMGTYTAFFPAHLLDESDVWRDLGFYDRWPNFGPEELRSKGNGDLRIHYATLDAMQRLRNLLKRPLVVNSYYRDPDYNAKVGGAAASRHLAGMAVDTPTNNTEKGRWTLWHYATLAGFTGLGIYRGFTHLDTGPHRVWGSIDIRNDDGE